VRRAAASDDWCSGIPGSCSLESPETARFRGVAHAGVRTTGGCSMYGGWWLQVFAHS
jgi:hypothetical protein